ncbi:hypothetical protein V8E55_005116 [Tylopilus felleus]
MGSQPLTPQTSTHRQLQEFGDSQSLLLEASPAASTVAASAASNPSFNFSTVTESGSSPNTSPAQPPTSREALKLARHTGKHTMKIQSNMHARYLLYRPWIAPPQLELQFAQKAMGDISFTDLNFEDIVEGHHKFTQGLTLMSDETICTTYTAKIAAKKCILIHITLAKVDVNALEKEAEDELAVYEEDDCIQVNMGGHGVVEDDIEFYHAIYAEELVALLTADLQLAHMVGGPHRKKHGMSDDSDDPGDIIFRAVISKYVALGNSSLCLFRPYVCPSTLIKRALPLDDMAPEPVGLSQMPEVPLLHNDYPLIYSDLPPTLYKDYPALLHGHPQSSIYQQEGLSQPSSYKEPWSAHPTDSSTSPSSAVVSDWVNSFPGQWVVPDNYTYELTPSGALAHPAHDFLGHAVYTAEQQLANSEIDLDEPSYHVLALRPARGGKRR